MDNKNNARLGKGLSSIFGQDVSKVLDGDIDEFIESYLNMSKE